MKRVYCDICDEELPVGHRYKSRIGDLDLCEKCKDAEMDIAYIQEYRNAIMMARIRREK
jgi:hypothetical protein